MYSTLLALVAIALVSATASTATPLPNGGPSGLPPNNPTATIAYKGNGSASLAAYGTYLDALTQCTGLAGGFPITYVNVFTTYPSDGRRAYKVQFFGTEACRGAPLVATDFFYNNGDTLKADDGSVAVPKSARFIPA
ncbi:hypothetical protein H9P43_002005 [Blastocladiella emersonii ATCC 22665]|nr:hypothetical protein H9P43_002005 [Blastocladiella emersonii ATCC 22665]